MEHCENCPEAPHWRLFAFLTLLGLALLANFQALAERAFRTEGDLAPIDFPVFYIGGKVALERGATPLYYPPADSSQGYKLLYEYADPSTPWAKMARANGFPHILQFTNPPFSALVMEPFALIPWQWAYIIWQSLMIIMTAGATYLTLKLTTPAPTLEIFTIFFIAVCFFFPTNMNLVFGQTNVTIQFLWTLGVYLLSRQKPLASAFCFALGTVMKISPVVAVPLLIIRRQWRWLAAYVAIVVAMTGISISSLGWNTHLIWLTKIYPSISAGLGNHLNRSLAGLIDVVCGPKYFATSFSSTEWPIPPGLSLFERACSLMVGLGFLFWCWRKRKDSKGLLYELILLPLVYLLAAPFSWPHHFVIALLPLTYLWAKAREATTSELVALLLSTLALGTELPMELAAYSPWAGPHLTILAIAIWPAATCALIWVGARMYNRTVAIGH